LPDGNENPAVLKKLNKKSDHGKPFIVENIFTVDCKLAGTSKTKWKYFWTVIYFKH
jgi:hypothetical protein